MRPWQWTLSNFHCWLLSSPFCKGWSLLFALVLWLQEKQLRHGDLCVIWIPQRDSLEHCAVNASGSACSLNPICWVRTCSQTKRFFRHEKPLERRFAFVGCSPVPQGHRTTRRRCRKPPFRLVSLIICKCIGSWTAYPVPLRVPEFGGVQHWSCEKHVSWSSSSYLFPRYNAHFHREVQHTRTHRLMRRS